MKIWNLCFKSRDMEPVPCLAGKKKMLLFLMTEELSSKNGYKTWSSKHT